jgi:hypothetical protein
MDATLPPAVQRAATAVIRAMREVKSFSGDRATIPGEARARPGGRTWDQTCRGLDRAVDQLIRLARAKDPFARSPALKLLQSLGAYGVGRVIGALRAARSTPHRLRLMRVLAEVGAVRPIAARAALYSVVEEHQDERHVDALHRALRIICDRKAARSVTRHRG